MVSRFFTPVGNHHIRCDVCPRYCILGEGQRGLCFVRKNVDGKLMLTTYGRSSGFAVDPIEKKPLYHFYPGSSVLSFGTAGCNLTCKFCQNWDMSKSRQMDILNVDASPRKIARSAADMGVKSVAFTYNDPVIFLEYAIDTAIACHELGINTVAVTAGYINPEPGAEFFSHMDAINVDLKGITDRFYQKFCSAHLQPVLDSLNYIANETDIWLEITNLIIPGINDSESDFRELCTWIATTIGPDVPLHFSAFHPAYKMMDTPVTPLQTLQIANRIASQSGINYVYLGNVNTPSGQDTICPHCKSILIRRTGYTVQIVDVDHGSCSRCGTPCVGNWT